MKIKAQKEKKHSHSWMIEEAYNMQNTQNVKRVYNIARSKTDVKQCMYNMASV